MPTNDPEYTDAREPDAAEIAAERGENPADHTPEPEPPEEEPEETALALTGDGLLPARLVQELVTGFEEEDMDGYADTDLPLTYCAIRQKNLMTDEGEMVQASGWIRFGPARNPIDRDVPWIQGVIIGSAEVRSKFQQEDSAQPECGSKNMVTAVDWGRKANKDWSGKVGGQEISMEKGDPLPCILCPDNRLSPYYHGDDRLRCKENIHFFVEEQQRDEVICFQVTPGGRASWAEFRAKAYRQFKREYRAANPDAAPPKEFPWIHFIVKIATKFVKKASMEYFIPSWEFVGRAPTNLVPMLRERRNTMAARFEATKDAAAGNFGEADEEASTQRPPGRAINNERDEDLPF